jgi:hypothetical protein
MSYRLLLTFLVPIGLFTASCYTIPHSDRGGEEGAAGVTIASTERHAPAESPVIELKRYDLTMIEKIIDRARYDFYNALMYRNPDEWSEKIVGVIGVFPGTGPRAEQFINISLSHEFHLNGSYNGRAIDVIVTIDHPLPMTAMYGKMVPVLSALQPITVFGVLKNLEQKMDENGYTRAIPSMECLLIYDKEDYSFKRPLWINSRLELLPEGTVTVDSLKYEFDRRHK